MKNEKAIWQAVFNGDITKAHALSCVMRSPAPPRKSHPNQRSALYFDISLRSHGGHQIPTALAYETRLQGHRIPLYVVCSLGAPSGRLQHTRPHFAVSHHSLAHKPIETAQELDLVQQYYQTEYAEVLERYPASLVFSGTTRFVNLAALARALVQAAVPPRLAVFTVLEGSEVPDCADPSIIRSGYIEAARLLHEHDVFYRLIVETTSIRDFLVDCGFLPQKVCLFQYVAANNTPEPSPAPKGKWDFPRVGYVGGSRPVRRPDLIADLITKPTVALKARWSAQLDLAYLERIKGAACVDRLLALQQHGQIDLYPTGLDDYTYYELLGSLDILVMPYTDRYHNIGSGVLYEAICAGLIPVLPRRSSMYAMYSSLGGTPPQFEQLDQSGLEAAITDALERITPYREQALHVLEAWRLDPSSGMAWWSELDYLIGQALDV